MNFLVLQGRNVPDSVKCQQTCLQISDFFVEPSRTYIIHITYYKSRD